MRLDLYRRDGRRVRRIALEIAKNVTAFERNVERGGEGEALRFVLIETLARTLLRAARRPSKRYWRDRP